MSRSVAAMNRIKADERHAARWFVGGVILIGGAWLLKWFDVYDATKTYKEELAIPLVVAFYYLMKQEIRKIIQEEFHDQAVE